MQNLYRSFLSNTLSIISTPVNTTSVNKAVNCWNFFSQKRSLDASFRVYIMKLNICSIQSTQTRFLYGIILYYEQWKEIRWYWYNPGINVPWITNKDIIRMTKFIISCLWYFSFSKILRGHGSLPSFTKWGRHKMAAIFQTVFSNAFF